MTITPVGIDLGTTYSAVAVLDASGEVRLLHNAEGAYLTPSVLLFDGANQVVVGQTAKDARADTPDLVAEFVKRSMGSDYRYAFHGDLYSAVELSSLILKKLKQDAEQTLREPVRQAVITCPAYFGAERRDATEQAAKLAGLEVLALISEPTAAAYAFGMGGQKSGTVLVFDLGGGTFDVTALRFGQDGALQVLLSDGDAELGGKDFDDALMELLLTRLRQEYGVNLSQDLPMLAELRTRAERAKHELTQRESTTLTLAAAGQRLRASVTRAEFEQAIRPLLEGMKLTVQMVLDDCGLRVHDVDDVLLVGGATRVPAVRRMLAEIFGREPNASIHPDEAVARGAALFAAKLLTVRQPAALLPPVRERGRALPSIQDVVPHSIGVTALDDEDILRNSVILTRGQALPAAVLEHFQTHDDGQTQVKVDVNEGEGDDLDYVQPLGSFVLTMPAARPKGSPIDVRVTLDLSGIIRVTAIDVVSGREEAIAIDYTSNLHEPHAAARRERMDRHTVS